VKTLDWLYRICRWTLGGLFIFAGTAKLLDPERFAVIIDAFGIVPEVMLAPMAIGLPVLEVVAGIGLIFEVRGSLALIAGLLLVFITILVYAIWMGLDVDCGCFGPSDPEAEAFHSIKQSLVRDLVMMAGVAFLYVWRWFRDIRLVGIKTIINQLLTKRK
jgi:hypothetical protein